MNSRQRAFTLLELLIYVGILGIAGFLVTSILSNVSRTYLQSRSRTEVVQNLRIATQILETAIGGATAINSASGPTLNLATETGSTVFTLSGGKITQDGVPITSSNVTVNTLDFSIVSAVQSTIDPVYHWAWGGGASASGHSGVGWIDFNPSIGNVRVPLGVGDFFGYAQIKNTGSFVALNCATPDYCVYQYKVSSDANGKLAGWAWSDNIGWISFCGNTAGPSTWDGTKWVCPASPTYQVSIATSTGEFSGWAWAGDYGWISFNCNQPEIGNTCATSDYKVIAQKRVGRPLNAIKVTMEIAFNTSNPLAAYRETYTFSVALSQPSAVTVTAINPASRSLCGTICTPNYVTGTNFKSGATVKLIKSGQPDIVSTGSWSGSGTSISGGTFDLTGAASGSWDVEVINPTGEIGILPNGFTMD